MTQDRYGITIDGKHFIHSTVQRDYLCDECGSKLATRWFEDEPGHWRTVCTADPSHDGIIHKMRAAYIEQEQMVGAIIAADVWDGLPQELREQLKEVSCQSSE